MKVAPIGIIDMGIHNISILNALGNEFKTENFIYINDLEKNDYEGLAEEEIQKRVQVHTEFLLAKKVKLIVVVSNTIMEYCRDYFEAIAVPVVNIVDSIINQVNSCYEHRNMAFMATDNITKANIYQKNFRYNHLYNIISDTLLVVVEENKMKTSASFNATLEAFKPVFKKDIDVIIPTAFNFLLLNTEISEYMKEIDILNLNALFIEKVKAALLTIENLNYRGKGKVTIVINMPVVKVEFRHLLKVKYEIKKVKFHY